MSREKIMQELGISCFKNIYHMPYREKTIFDYMKKVKSEGKEPKLYERCVEHFKNLDLDIPDGFEINIVFLGKVHKTEEPIYGITIENETGIVYSGLLNYDLSSDDSIDMALNSLCKAMYLKYYRMVKVKFIMILKNHTFEQYFKDYLETLKEVE